MRPIAALAMLAALFGADAAIAAGAGAINHRSPARHATVPLHKASRTTHRRPRQHALHAATLDTASNPSARVYRASDGDQGLPSRAGLFRSERAKEAGWGVDHAGTQAVVGLYQRPAQPDIPGPQTYHSPEGRGAAGLSLSFKLGQ